MGWIGGKQINLSDVSIAVTTRNATVAVQSLDERNIRESRSIMISLGARSIPKRMNQLPFHSEPVIGRLTIHGRGGLKLFKQIGSALAQQEIGTSYQNGQYQINLDKNLDTYWLILK
jgi:hypothetical protein